jgi:hypothetical protein
MGCLGWGKPWWDPWGGRLGVGQTRYGMLGEGGLGEGLNSTFSAVGAPVWTSQCEARKF